MILIKKKLLAEIFQRNKYDYTLAISLIETKKGQNTLKKREKLLFKNSDLLLRCFFEAVNFEIQRGSLRECRNPKKVGENI